MWSINILGLASLMAAGIVVIGCESPTGDEHVNDDQDGDVCTLIGCFDGLTVEVHAAPGTEIDVEAVAPGHQVRTGSCTASESGSCNIRFEGFSPEEVSLVTSDGEQEEVVTVMPTYEVIQPNGADCPPVCHQATVRIELSTP